MRSINLLPQEEQRERKLELLAGQVLSFWTWVAATLVFMVLLGLAGSFYLQQQISVKNNEINNKTVELRASATKELEQEVASLNSQIALIDTMRRDHYYWSKVLVELVHVLDSNTRLTTLQMDRATGELEVTGEAGTRDNLLAFWSAVKKSALFKGIDFPLTNLEKNEDAVFKFTIDLNELELKQE